MRERDWQERLLPTMRWMVVVLATFFFIASLGQLAYMQYQIGASPAIDEQRLDSLLEELLASTTNAEWTANQLALLYEIETNTIARRYHITQAGWVGNLWIKYLGFVTGMILAVVGATFVLGKLRTPETELGGEVATMKYHIKSASPGIILAFLGVLLMMGTIWVQIGTEVGDGNTYLPGLVLTSPFEDGGATQTSSLKVQRLGER